MDILNVVSNAIALFMLWMFLSSGVAKLLPTNRDYYQNVMAAYGVKLPELATSLLVLLAVLELLSGVLSVLPVTRFIGLILCSTLLSVYLLVMCAQLIQGKTDMDCGCGGPGRETTISNALIVRNAMLILLVFVALLAAKPMAHQMSDWLMALPMALMMIFLYLCFDQLIANGQKLNALKEVMRG